MSTAPAIAPQATSKASRSHAHFVLRRLHSLTGIIFGGYLVVHLLVNATLAEGGRIFQIQVDKIHSLPFLMVIETVFIYLPILFHTVYGIWVIFSGQPNVVHYPYGKNWFYLLQRISAIIIVFFMLFHILGMKGVLGTSWEFVPEKYALESVKYHFQQHWSVMYLVYPIGVLASCYHLANGFWAAAITWGLTITERAQRRWGIVCFGIFLFTLICGMLALYGVMRINDVTAPPWLQG